MGFGPIQFGGLGSGLDTAAIIEALLQLEKKPIKVLEAQKANEKKKLDLFGTLEKHVKALREEAESLSKLSGFLAHTVTPSVEGIASVSLSGDGAIAGTHSLEVQALAAADRYAFDGVADPTADLGAGTVSFDYDGESYSVDVAADASSLNEIAAAIESEADGAVSATIVNTGTESSPSYQLVLRGDDTGANFTIDNLSSTIAGLANPTQLTAASNASVSIDGLTVQRSTNVFSDVVPGISFTAESVGTMTFSVEVDGEGIKANVEDFVSAYNKVIEFINGQNSFDSDDGPGGLLFGDSALASIRSTLQKAVFGVDLAVVQADTEGYSTLGLVGIDVQLDGTLKIDDSKFEGKLAANLDAMASLFTDEEHGLAVKLEAAIGNLVDSSTNPLGGTVPGLFDRREDTINSIISSLEDQIEKLEMHVAKTEETLIAKFTALEELMAGLNAQLQFLNNQMSLPQLQQK